MKITIEWPGGLSQVYHASANPKREQTVVIEVKDPRHMEYCKIDFVDKKP